MEIKQGGVISRLLADVPITRMFRAEQLFPRERIAPADIPAAVAGELSREPFRSKIRPGMSIAITAGSRGIANVDLITRSIVDFVKARGAVPFIVPAMGSHGGGTAQGQKEVLDSLGITEQNMGVKVITCDTCRSIGQTYPHIIPWAYGISCRQIPFTT